MIYRKRDGTLEIKIILVGMLIGCSYLVGEDISKRYIKRHKQLNDLIRVLEIIRMDLAFGMYTLEEIFRNISLKDEYDFNEFFSKFADELSKEDGKTIDNILNETIHILYKDTYLKENEIEEFKKLILSLGKSEVESQERLIDLTVENLKKLDPKTTTSLTPSAWAKCRMMPPVLFIRSTATRNIRSCSTTLITNWRCMTKAAYGQLFLIILTICKNYTGFTRAKPLLFTKKWWITP